MQLAIGIGEADNGAVGGGGSLAFPSGALADALHFDDGGFGLLPVFFEVCFFLVFVDSKKQDSYAHKEADDGRNPVGESWAFSAACHGLGCGVAVQFCLFQMVAETGNHHGDTTKTENTASADEN